MRLESLQSLYNLARPERHRNNESERESEA